MPHTSRRARFSKPNTRKAVLDLGDGWSRVEYGHRTDEEGGSMRPLITLPPVDKDLTVEKMQEEHEKALRKWRDTDQRKRVVAELERRRPKNGKVIDGVASEGWGVKKALCVALGSLSVEWHTRARSVWQFAFFMDLVHLLQAEHTSEEGFKIFAQEPRFSDLDIEFLQTLNITVLETPAGEAEIGPESFVLVAHLEWMTEVPYMQRGRDAPLYITPNAEWTYDSAERMKKRGTTILLEACDAAMAASTELRATHHELRFGQTVQSAESLTFSFYIIKNTEERDNDDLVSKAQSLQI